MLRDHHRSLEQRGAEQHDQDAAQKSREVQHARDPPTLVAEVVGQDERRTPGIDGKRGEARHRDAGSDRHRDDGGRAGKEQMHASGEDQDQDRAAAGAQPDRKHRHGEVTG